MLAIVRASFVLTHDGAPLVETEPITFVVQSRDGSIEALVTAPDDPDKAAGLLRVLSAIPGKRSDGFNQVMQYLQQR